MKYKDESNQTKQWDSIELNHGTAHVTNDVEYGMVVYRCLESGTLARLIGDI